MLIVCGGALQSRGAFRATVMKNGAPPPARLDKAAPHPLSLGKRPAVSGPQAFGFPCDRPLERHRLVDHASKGEGIGVIGAVAKGRTAWGWLTVALMLLAALTASPRSARAGYAALVVDGQTGHVLEEVNADQENHPASLTKLMTLYLAFEALRDGRLRWDEMLPVSRNAANKSPTKLNLRPGQRISLRDCVLGMIVVSANDAATVVGEALSGGSETVFAQMMTTKARELGMTRTLFHNASGLPDPRQISTARDMARLAMAIHHDFPEHYHLFATRSFVFEGTERMGHNRLMYRYPGMDGMKTGFTNASGSNLVSSAVRDGRRLFGVVFGGRSAAARDQLMATLLDNAFEGEQTDPRLVAAAAGQALGHAVAQASLRKGRHHHAAATPAVGRRTRHHGAVVAAPHRQAHAQPHAKTRTPARRHAAPLHKTPRHDPRHDTAAHKPRPHHRQRTSDAP